MTRGVLLARQPRFHWRNESEAQRHRMLARIGEIGATVLAYAYRPVAGKQDRARALCLNRLVWDLAERDIGQVVFESREERNDRKDRLTIVRAQKAGRAAPGLTYVFVRPHEEPLVWLPDAMAGAVTAHLADGNDTYLALLPEESVTLVLI